MAHREKQPWEDENTWNGRSPTFVPEVTAYNAYSPTDMDLVSTSVRDRVGAWFIRPLENFRGDDAFACLMMMLPLIEKTLRYRLSEEDETRKLEFSKGSRLCRELGKFLKIPEDDAFEFWRAFRNGLLHRATIDMPYALHPEDSAVSPVAMRDGILHVYVWALRDRLVTSLKNADRAMWTRERFPLPEIFHGKKG